MYDCSFGLEVHGGGNWAIDYAISHRTLVLKGGNMFNPQSPERPKMNNCFYGFCFEGEL